MLSSTIRVLAAATALAVGVRPARADDPKPAPKKGADTSEETVSPPPAPIEEARVLCQVTDNGRPVKGRICGPDGVWTGCDEGVALAPGPRRVRIALADDPEVGFEVRHVQLESGGRVALTVSFETGEIVLHSQRAGRPVEGQADVWADGAVLTRIPSDTPVKLRIGTYVVDARAEGQTERFLSVHVVPRARTALLWQMKP